MPPKGTEGIVRASLGRDSDRYLEKVRFRAILSRRVSGRERSPRSDHQHRSRSPGPGS
ncbi:MAG: hypothetical protein MZU79_05115 [Anaerotruncus sp.]|nr:hypothetical protein [Anaerotruncus sp.]